MENRLCDDNGWNGVGAIKKCMQTSSSTTLVCGPKRFARAKASKQRRVRDTAREKHSKLWKTFNKRENNALDTSLVFIVGIMAVAVVVYVEW